MVEGNHGNVQRNWGALEECLEKQKGAKISQ